MSEPGLDERAERAFRAAVAHQPEVEIDPTAIRHRHRVRRTATAMVSVAVALAVAGGAVALGQGLARRPEIAGPVVPAQRIPPPSDPSLRTVYYRDIGFDVPVSWSFGTESPFCGERVPATDGYVQLGDPILVPRPSCLPGEQPTAPQVDHVVVTPADGATVATTTYADGWWTSIRRVGEVRVRAVARQRTAAIALVASASQRQSSCAPHTAMENNPNARPAAFDLGAVERVDALTLCQYDVTGNVATSGLRAVAQVTGQAAGRALRAFRSAPADQRSCAARTGDPLDAAIVVQLATAAGPRDLYVRMGTCSSAQDFGIDTVDDGTTQRRLTYDSCAALRVEPVSIDVLTGDAGQVC